MLLRDLVSDPRSISSILIVKRPAIWGTTPVVAVRAPVPSSPLLILGVCRCCRSGVASSLMVCTASSNAVIICSVICPMVRSAAFLGWPSGESFCVATVFVSTAAGADISVHVTYHDGPVTIWDDASSRIEVGLDIAIRVLKGAIRRQSGLANAMLTVVFTISTLLRNLTIFTVHLAFYMCTLNA